MNASKNKRYRIIIVIQSIVIIFLIGSLFISRSHEDLIAGSQRVFDKIIEYGRLNIFNKLTFLNDLSMEYGSITEVLNNREIAILFFSVIFVLLILSIKKVRSSFFKVLKSLFVKQFLFMYLLTFLFTVVIIIILERIGFWKFYLLKETITWFVLVGLISNFKTLDKAKDINYFKKIIKDNVSIMIAIPFIANLYSFTLLYELVLLGILIVFSASLAVIETQPNFKDPYYDKTKTVVIMILSIISIFYLGNSIRGIIINFEELDLLKRLKSMGLPSILSIAFILFNYIYVLYARYQVMFIRIGFKKIIKERKRPYLYLRIVLACNVQIPKIDSFLNNSDVLRMHISNYKDVSTLIKNYKRAARERSIKKLDSLNEADKKSVEDLIYDYIESNVEGIDEFEIFTDAADKFQKPLLDIYYLYSKIQSSKYHTDLLPEAENKLVTFFIMKDSHYFTMDKNHTWYYKGRKIRMGEIPPLPDSMERLGPLEGKAIDVEFSCSIDDTWLYVKTTLPDGFILHLTTNKTKSFISGEVKDNECKFDIKPGTRDVKLTSPIVSIMKNLDKETVGEKGRNLVGNLVKFDPIFGNTIEWECSLSK